MPINTVYISIYSAKQCGCCDHPLATTNIIASLLSPRPILNEQNIGLKSDFSLHEINFVFVTPHNIRMVNTFCSLFILSHILCITSCPTSSYEIYPYCCCIFILSNLLQSFKCSILFLHESVRNLLHTACLVRLLT